MLRACVFNLAVIFSVATSVSGQDAPDVAQPPSKADAKTERVNSPWTQFTVDQLVEHLGLKGGNISFEFQEPVFMQLKAVQKRAAGEPLRVVLDAWSSLPGRRYHLMVKVQDVDAPAPTYVRNKIQLKYTRYDRTTDNSVPGVTATIIKDTGGGYTLNISRPDDVRRLASGGVWRDNETTVQVGETTEIYQFHDMDAPDDRFFRLSLLFSKTRPEAKQ